MKRLLVAVLLAACAHSESPKAPDPAARPREAATAPAPATERLAANAPRATPAGSTFTAPAGWSLTTHPTTSVTVMEAPEPDMRVVLVDVQGVAEAQAAVDSAWRAFRADFARPVKIVQPRPARKGWDERKVFNYETSPNERATVFALANRKAGVWTVMLVDASDMTFERRLSGFLLLRDSLRPKGYQRESFKDRAAHPLDAARIDALKRFVSTAQAQLDIPGVGLALIDGGKVVFEGGLGLREMGKPEPVDADTLFIAASNTKAMTTLLLAKLVDAGTLTWDAPVAQVFSGFKLGDPETTRQVLLRHLVCACTGLPRQDLEWLLEFKSATPKSEVELLGTMQPTTKFGETFQYSNLLAATAGFVAAHVLSPDKELGAGYDEAMKRHVFDPLGMKSTTFDFAKALKANHAMPHGLDVDGKPAAAVMAVNDAVVPLRPAGGAWTNAHDLARYVQVELSRGVLPDGKRLVSEANLLARRAPQVTVGEDVTYGMGLETDATYGVPVVHHGGSLIGYKSDMMFLPDHGVGAVILTNSEMGSYLLRPFQRRLLEVLFDGVAEAEEDVVSAAGRVRARIAKERERLVVPADPSVTGRLAPRYANAALGEVTVKRQGAATFLDFGEWASTAASRKNDDGTVSVITIDPGADGFELVLGERGSKRTLTMRDAQHEYVFDEK